jgi:tetrahydromethanopterin S-methyltransferase subunit C
MESLNSRTKEYLVSALLGAVIGGLAVTVITNAIPKMMSRTMCAMMNNMMAQAGDDTLSPEEM